MTAFRESHYDLGGGLTLGTVNPANAARLGAEMARMPPWSVIGVSAGTLTRGLSGGQPGFYHFEVQAEGRLAGTINIQNPFLRGPYLQTFALLPDFQGQAIGGRLLAWMEAEARREEARNLWLCVSTFNTRARAFYERFGFEAVAVLDKLVWEGGDELFMRKRLGYGCG